MRASAKAPSPAISAAHADTIHVDPNRDRPLINPVWGAFAFGAQAKLAVSAPDDPFEREAGSIAGEVVGMPEPRVQRACTACSNQGSALDEDLNQGSVQGVQAKLRIGAANDHHEQEAERLAAAFVSGQQHVGGVADASNAATVQRKCAACAAASELTVRTKKDTSDETPHTQPASDIETRLDNPAARGSVLTLGVRERFETYFHANFENVRIHTDTAANELSIALGAEAFTYGSDIYFAQGRFQSGTPGGDRLLAHELTHVVQQAGGNPSVQRDNKNVKSYERQVTGLKPGTDIHNDVEARVRKENAELVTEAPIPGNTASGKSKYNKCAVGWADFYKSKPAATVTGIFFDCEVDKDTQKQKGYNNFPDDYPDKARLLQHPAKTAGTLKRVPRMVSGSVTGSFPSEVWVGDLKPATKVSILGGNKQLSNYQTGFSRFANDANGNSVDVKVLKNNQLKIPDALNYKDFTNQSKNKSDALLYPAGSDHRIWMYPYRDGLWLYFDLHKNLNTKGFGDRLKAVNDHLEALKKEIPRKEKIKTVNKSPLPGVSSSLLQTTVGRKALRAGKSPDANTPLRKKPLVGQRFVQRDKAKTLDEWENRRKKWSADEAEPFLAKESATIVKVEIDDLLNISDKDSLGSLHKFTRNIWLWSGKLGALIGKIAYYFGAGWERIKKFFASIRDRFMKAAEKLPNASDVKLGGWKKNVLAIILKGIKKGFPLVVNLILRLFQNCLEAIADGALEKFWKMIDEKTGASDKLEQMLQPFKEASEKIHELEDTLKKKFDGIYEVISDFVKVVTEGQKISSFIGQLEIPIRLIFQAISCGFPPGWGCLWGIVGQFAMSFVVWTITKACAFQELLNRMACKILDTQLVKSFIKWVKEAIEGLGLKEVIELGGATCDYSEKLECKIDTDPGCFELPGGGGGGSSGSSGSSGGASNDDTAEGPQKPSPRTYQEARKAIDAEAQQNPLPCYELEPGVPATWQHVQKFLDLAAANRLSGDVIRAIHYQNCGKTSGKYILSQMMVDVASPPTPVPEGTPAPAACSQCTPSSGKGGQGGGGQGQGGGGQGGGGQGQGGGQGGGGQGQGGGKGGGQGRGGSEGAGKQGDGGKQKDGSSSSGQSGQGGAASQSGKQEDKGIAPPPEGKPGQEGQEDQGKEQGKNKQDQQQDENPLNWTKEDQEWLDKLLNPPPKETKNKNAPQGTPEEGKSGEQSKSDKLETIGGILKGLADEARENGDETTAEKLDQRAKELFDESRKARDQEKK